MKGWELGEIRERTGREGVETGKEGVRIGSEGVGIGRKVGGNWERREVGSGREGVRTGRDWGGNWERRGGNWERRGRKWERMGRNWERMVETGREWVGTGREWWKLREKGAKNYRLATFDTGTLCSRPLDYGIYLPPFLPVKSHCHLNTVPVPFPSNGNNR